jgi:dTDP-4-amino-4,6-dideoxy-D-galactose acyltransferase
MNAEGLCEYLEWDSEFFGCHVARLTVPQLDPQLWVAVEAWCRSRGIDCLYYLCDAHDLTSIHTAENQDFRLVDERLTLVHDLRILPAGVNGTSPSRVRLCLPEDLPSLRAIARSSHVDSRFYHDGGFSRSRCDALYETWIERSCLGAREEVFVAELNSQVVGYVTCLRPEPTAGLIGLLAVAPDALGQGLGHTLIQRALHWFAGQGLSHVRVVTQGRNARALRRYDKSGFVLHQSQRWYHRWFPARNVRSAS